MTTPAFIAAILITRSPRQAEAVVLNAIERWDCREDSILQSTTEASLECNHNSTPEEIAEAAALLPAELRRVLDIPSPLARCFVLRTLLGLTREGCAQALNLKPAQVDERTHAAFLALAPRTIGANA